MTSGQPTSEPPVYQIKITLLGTQPPIWRRLQVLGDSTLSELHDAIQAAMGWTDSHLYEFRAGGVGWGVPDPDGYYDGPLPANKSSTRVSGTSARRSSD